MKVIARVLLMSVLAMSSSHVFADSVLPASARSEIEALFSEMTLAKCAFNRNGTWYEADEATRHLRKKYEYLDGKGALKSAEDFITLAGTKSSQTGKPYLVRCGEEDAQTSSEWLRRQLDAMRSESKP